MPGKPVEPLDYLESPFNIRLYGRMIGWMQPVKEKLSPRVRATAEKYGVDPGLAYIHGYSYQGIQTKLAKPAVYLVFGQGDAARGWDEYSSEKGFVTWDVEPSEATIWVDVRPGVFEEFLIAPGTRTETTGQPEGGTLIRGADGRVYVIPANLDGFEISDQQEISSLQAEPGPERPVTLVRALSARSALVARSALATRSALALRSAVAAPR